MTVTRLASRLTIAASLFAASLVATGSTASAQRAGSWVDIAAGAVGSGASASGPLQFAKSKSKSKNGLGFGHGFAVGAGPNGIALSNSIGAGGGPLGVAHNVQLNVGAGGAHLSHGGVVSEGGNRRVIAGGETGTSQGRVRGGSYATGFGNRTRAYSKSRTRHWSNGPTQSTNGSIQSTQPSQSPAAYGISSSQPSSGATMIGGNGQSRFRSASGSGRSAGSRQVFTTGRFRSR